MNEGTGGGGEDRDRDEGDCDRDGIQSYSLRVHSGVKVRKKNLFLLYMSV